jgi:drug/metabolite transporter (DMT)-like permease
MVRGLAVTVLGVVLLSFEALVIRLVSSDVWTLIWWRSAPLAVVLILWMALCNRAALSPRQLGLPGLMAVLTMAGGVCAFVPAVMLTSTSNALVIASTSPIFAVVFAWLLLGERASKATWVAGGVLALGIAAILHKSLDTSHLTGDLFAVAYAVWLANYVVAVRACPEGSAVAILGFGSLLTALLSAPFAAPLSVSAQELILLLGLALIIVPVSLVLIAIGTRTLSAPDVVLVMMLEMILGPLWIWLALGEVPMAATVAVGVLVFVTVAMHAYATLSAPSAAREA